LGEKTTHIDKAKSNKKHTAISLYSLLITLTVQQLLPRLTDCRKPFAGVVIFDIMVGKKALWMLCAD
jgi:hypothetical protein